MIWGITISPFPQKHVTLSTRSDSLNYEIPSVQQTLTQLPTQRQSIVQFITIL